MEQILKLDDVIVDNDLNPRQGALDQDAVLDYSAHIDDLPPMHAFDVQGFYFLVGGFHRYAAHRLAQRSEGRFVVHQGDRTEAKEFADLDNLKHGLRLNRAERRRVIERQLKRHPEWSDVRLALACYTTDKTVRSVREELEERSEIPRLDVLVGADGIERPRTIAPRPPVEPKPDDRQTTLESAAPVDPALLRPVEELEERYQIATAPTAEPAPWEREAEADDDAGEDPDAELEIEAEAKQELEDETRDDDEMPAQDDQPDGAELPPPAPAPPTPLPAPAAPIPLPPPPVVQAAMWQVVLSYRPGSPAPLVSVSCGGEARQAIPADVAAVLSAAIEARTEKPIEEAPAVEPIAVPIATPDWLIVK